VASLYITVTASGSSNPPPESVHSKDESNDDLPEHKTYPRQSATDEKEKRVRIFHRQIMHSLVHLRVPTIRRDANAGRNLNGI